MRSSQLISRPTDLGDDGRLIAVGDIHGRLGKLVGLLDQIRPTATDQLVFLGDYIDRGPDSYEVVERLIALRRDLPRTVLLRGNHEQLALDLLADPTASHRTSWLERDGGALTVASYRAAGKYLLVHRDFFSGLAHSFTTEHYFFCHAGVRPGVPVDRQRPADLLEIREPFLSSRASFGRIVVHGHSAVERPHLLSNRINIDTGAANYGPLTAIELPSARLFQHW
jgi:serine/threonine protein phosphatase 1